MNVLASLGLALGAFVVGRRATATARVPSREVPRRPRSLESVVGLPPRLSLESRKAAVVDITQPDRVFKPDLAERIELMLARSGAEKIETDEQGALLFKLVPLGKKSALDLVNEARRRGADVFLSLACVLPATSPVPRIIAVTESGKRPQIVQTRFYFARLPYPQAAKSEVVKPETKLDGKVILGSVLDASVPPVTEIPVAAAAKISNGVNHKVDLAEMAAPDLLPKTP